MRTSAQLGNSFDGSFCCAPHPFLSRDYINNYWYDVLDAGKIPQPRPHPLEPSLPKRLRPTRTGRALAVDRLDDQIATPAQIRCRAPIACPAPAPPPHLVGRRTLPHASFAPPPSPPARSSRRRSPAAPPPHADAPADPPRHRRRAAARTRSPDPTTRITTMPRRSARRRAASPPPPAARTARPPVRRRSSRAAPRRGTRVA